ncbi:hypothetical protein BX600DRAFT_269297 [Xylariales sp. PMI_506]|nr:hypothetical protein BX600DRAFT_269297 [Xylariales sp. PMI_506]
MYPSGTFFRRCTVPPSCTVHRIVGHVNGVHARWYVPLAPKPITEAPACGPRASVRVAIKLIQLLAQTHRTITKIVSPPDNGVKEKGKMKAIGTVQIQYSTYFPSSIQSGAQALILLGYWVLVTPKAPEESRFAALLLPSFPPPSSCLFSA